MEITVSKEQRGVEELKMVFVEGEPAQVRPDVDVYELADKLSGVFRKAIDENLRKEVAWPMLRDVWRHYGFAVPDNGFNLAYAASQLLMKAVADRKKKFDDNLWGIGDEWPESPDSTAG